MSVDNDSSCGASRSKCMQEVDDDHTKSLLTKDILKVLIIYLYFLLI